MRHRKKVTKLSRTSSHRKAMLRNMATSLFNYESLKTTIKKAKALRSYAEKLITRAKNDSVHSRRLVARYIQDKKILEKLFTDIGLRYQGRNGGYTRIYRLGYRGNDGTEMAIIELVPEMLKRKAAEIAPLDNK